MTEKMKTTAPVLSVGADREQPNTKNHKEIIANETAQINLQAAQNPEKSRSGGLQTVSMTELYDTVYPPRTPVVDGFLYGGTYLFVGAPKVGKSFFMGQLAYHVAMGLPLWDYPVRKGTVLYLALEDDYARLQHRLSGMFGVECADNLYFATQAKTLNEGLDRQLEEFLKEHTDARLIIIDTLQKVREVGGDRYSYSSDCLSVLVVGTSLYQSFHTVSPDFFYIAVAKLKQKPRLLHLYGKQAVPYQVYAVLAFAVAVGKHYLCPQIQRSRTDV